MAAVHQKPLETGFAAKSEPSDILAGIDLTGKNAIVTGGYSGIGVETVRALKNAGAHVHVPARDVARARRSARAKGGQPGGEEGGDGGRGDEDGRDR